MVPAIVDRDIAGFVENRILYAIMREALHLLDEGVASAEAIDTIVKWGIGYKLAVIGPLELLDTAGLDIYTSVASYLNKDLNASPGRQPDRNQKVEAGKLGPQDPGRVFEYTRSRSNNCNSDEGGSWWRRGRRWPTRNTVPTHCSFSNHENVIGGRGACRDGGLVPALAVHARYPHLRRIGTRGVFAATVWTSLRRRARLRP